MIGELKISEKKGSFGTGMVKHFGHINIQEIGMNLLVKK